MEEHRAVAVKRLIIAAVLMGMTAVATPALAGPRSKGDPKPLGVVGCSNTMEHTQAYALHSDVDQMVLVKSTYGGGTPIKWAAERRNLWKTYDADRPSEGYDAIWWQLCWRWWEMEGAFDQPEQADLTAVLGLIRERDPDVTVFVSPINFYDPPGSCGVIGDAHPLVVEASEWVAAAFENVEPGPITGPLTAAHTDEDDCHINELAGFDLVGPQMVAFFDGGSQ